MQIVFAQQRWNQNIKHPKLFLAGPTPRSKDVGSWRPDALAILSFKYRFDGTVFVPESENWTFEGTYEKQIEWEWEALSTADCIVFWVPRDLNTMPAFTTNIEFGHWYDSGKVVLGFPDGSPKNKYLKYVADKHRIPFSNTLEGTIGNAVAKVGGAWQVTI